MAVDVSFFWKGGRFEMRDGIEIEMSQQKSDLSLEDLNNTYADRCKHLWESNQELELKTIMLNVKKNT